MGRAACTPSRNGAANNPNLCCGRALGFTRQQPPGVATLHRVFKRLDVDVFETVLAQWAQAALGDRGRGEASGAIALDGKALRGIHGEQLPGVRLVAAYDVRTGLVLGQKGGEAQNGTSRRGDDHSRDHPRKRSSPRRRPKPN